MNADAVAALGLALAVVGVGVFGGDLGGREGEEGKREEGEEGGEEVHDAAQGAGEYFPIEDGGVNGGR